MFNGQREQEARSVAIVGMVYAGRGQELALHHVCVGVFDGIVFSRDESNGKSEAQRNRMVGWEKKET